MFSRGLFSASCNCYIGDIAIYVRSLYKNIDLTGKDSVKKRKISNLENKMVEKFSEVHLKNALTAAKEV